MNLSESTKPVEARNAGQRRLGLRMGIPVKEKSVLPLEIIATLWGYFLFGAGIVVFIALLPLYHLLPAGKERKKEYFHFAVYFCFRFLVYSCPVLKLDILNPEKENHLRPAILISNHQSMLDIIMLLALGPKMIIVTKGWVWNNPLLGKVARYADYFCADDGYESLANAISDKIAKGYSVIIFPEGKRSFTGEIDRFHKGAFYLAEKLRSDVLPVIIRGTMDSVRRGTRLIKKSRIVLQYLPRIRVSDTSFGDNYTDRSRNIRHYMMREYEKV